MLNNFPQDFKQKMATKSALDPAGPPKLSARQAFDQGLVGHNFTALDGNWQLTATQQ